MGLFIGILKLILMSYSWWNAHVKRFAFVYNSLMIKSTKKISNWATVTVSNEYIWWLIIYYHAYCLLHTVMNSCTLGTAKSENAESTVKIKQRQESWAPNESWIVLVMWQTLGPCVILFTKDSRGLITLLTQVAAQQQQHSHYKPLFDDRNQHHWLHGGDA